MQCLLVFVYFKVHRLPVVDRLCVLSLHYNCVVFYHVMRFIYRHFAICRISADLTLSIVFLNFILFFISHHMVGLRLNN